MLDSRMQKTSCCERNSSVKKKKKHNSGWRGRRLVKALKAQVRMLSRRPQLPMVPTEIMPPAVLIYRSELDMIKNLTLEYPQLETGAKLYGFYSETGWPVIALVVGPGPHATHEYTRFIPDQETEGLIGHRLANMGMSHLGSFHSHHVLGLNTPSNIDVDVMQRVFDDATPPQKGFLCGITTITDGKKVSLNIYHFSKIDNRVQYRVLPLMVCDMMSPIRAGLEAVVVKGGPL